MSLLPDEGRVRTRHDGRDAALHGLHLVGGQPQLGQRSIDAAPEAVGPKRGGAPTRHRAGTPRSRFAYSMLTASLLPRLPGDASGSITDIFAMSHRVSS
jgi:hypothetical protein